MWRASFLLAFALAFFLATGARADDPAPTSPPGPSTTAPASVPVTAPVTAPVQRRWYGWELILGDLGAVAVTVAVGVSTPPDLLVGMASGGVIYVLSGPAIHIANGNGLGAGLSLLMRAGLPVVGGLVGSATCRCSDQYLEPFFAVVIGGSLGILTASVIDAAVLGWKPAETAPAVPVAPATSLLTWTPTAGVVYDASHRAAPTLGVTGSF